MLVAEVLAVGAWLLHLQDFGAQVAHGHAALERVRAVHGVLEQHVRVAGFELQFGERHEEFARIDIRLADAVIGQHLVIGRLIEELGLKGRRLGDVQISKKHANFMVNKGQGTAADMLELIRLVQETARRERGVALEPEIVIIGEER